jgi:hypothetical protein
VVGEHRAVADRVPRLTQRGDGAFRRGHLDAGEDFGLASGRSSGRESVVEEDVDGLQELRKARGCCAQCN